MDKMEIIKAKLTKDNTLVATYKDETGTITIEGKNQVTNDLLNSFVFLIPHLAFLCEMKEADGKESLDEMPENIESILSVSGYTIGGDGDSKGVTLTGKRFLKSSKVMNVNAPFTQFNNESEQYEFSYELEQTIEQCNYEVNEYIFNKKWKVVEQELPFADDSIPVEVQADNVPDAPIDNPDAAAFKELMKEKSVKATRKRNTKKGIINQFAS